MEPMSTQITLPVNRDAVANLSARNNEPAWLTEFRLQALDKAATLDNPIFEKTKNRALESGRIRPVCRRCSG